MSTLISALFAFLFFVANLFGWNDLSNNVQHSDGVYMAFFADGQPTYQSDNWDAETVVSHGGAVYVCRFDPASYYTGKIDCTDLYVGGSEEYGYMGGMYPVTISIDGTIESNYSFDEYNLFSEWLYGVSQNTRTIERAPFTNGASSADWTALVVLVATLLLCTSLPNPADKYAFKHSKHDGATLIGRSFLFAVLVIAVFSAIMVTLTIAVVVNDVLWVNGVSMGDPTLLGIAVILCAIFWFLGKDKEQGIALLGKVMFAFMVLCSIASLYLFVSTKLVETGALQSIIDGWNKLRDLGLFANSVFLPTPLVIKMCGKRSERCEE